jgi:Flp pilus assembly protein TadG
MTLKQVEMLGMVNPHHLARRTVQPGSVPLFGCVAKSERGSIAIISAVSLPFLLGFGALAVDASLWVRAKNGVQGAADAAANSVGASAINGDSAAHKQAEAQGVSASNGYQNGVNGVTVTMNHPPASGAYVGNALAYEVIVSAPQQLYLAKVFPSLTAPTVSGRAVVLTTTSPTCLLALEAIVGTDFTVNGNAPLTAQNCDVDSDSSGGSSINTNGGGSIHATNARTMGGVTGDVTVDGKIVTNGPYIADPYAGTRSIPTIPVYQPSKANDWGTSVANPTGVIAFQGNVTVNGSTTLAPGVYIIADGSLNVTGSLSGNGVTIVLTSQTPASDNGVFSFTGHASINLTAPTTGTTAGIALWADARLPLKDDKLTGSGVMSITGAIYLPGHTVTYAGNGGNAPSCTQIIAEQIKVTGTSLFKHQNCPPGVLDPAVTWALVE